MLAVGMGREVALRMATAVLTLGVVLVVVYVVTFLHVGPRLEMWLGLVGLVPVIALPVVAIAMPSGDAQDQLMGLQVFLLVAVSAAWLAVTIPKYLVRRQVRLGRRG
jgi:heme/copper-type cytochrome/quinol oxidase subunit 4